ncbi:hypothetical protein ACFL49_00725 [Candidatus Omnitrophota bacterium]
MPTLNFLSVMMIKRITKLRCLVFVLSFCSILYELLFAQGLAAFLENTVLRYSVTIGLYMFSLGFGSLFADGRLQKKMCSTLIGVEVLLCFIGGFSLVWLFAFEFLSMPRVVFMLLVHGLIMLVGFLSGMELPLLIELSNQERPHQENMSLGLNYVGAFIGTMCFAFIFYPRCGLLASSFFVGFLNVIAAVVLLMDHDFKEKATRAQFKFWRFVCAGFFVLLLGCLVASGPLDNFFINTYIG